MAKVDNFNGRIEIENQKPKPNCRFCGGECRALHDNGIIGPGYTEWDYVCKACGRVQ